MASKLMVSASSSVLAGIDRTLFDDVPHAPSGTTQRQLGAYYTPCSAADFMADWIIRHDGEQILEPSFGDGTFLRAIEKNAALQGFTSLHCRGVEIDPCSRAKVLQDRLIEKESICGEDFLSVKPFPVHAVIGNPPYVRLRHLPTTQRQHALNTAAAQATSMDPSGSVWMPFVLHSMRFLSVGGRLAFVLPYELTYVRYARPLWRKLGENFGSLRVLRTRERLFPDLMQDVVILLADNYRSQTNRVRYQAFERVEQLLQVRPCIDEAIEIDDLVRGKRAFMESLLAPELRALLRTQIATCTVPAKKLMTFNIGYVAGDKNFFHPDDQTVRQHQIPTRSLKTAITSTRALKGAGLRTSSLNEEAWSHLFFPDDSALTPGEQRYIAYGEQIGVSNRYKCRVREPWFIVPGTRIPDVILSVFSERPILLLNDGEHLASNSLLCGYRQNITSEVFATSWYSSLTRLQCELEVHALGGGVLVMVPREAGNVRLPANVVAEPAHMKHLDTALRSGQVDAAYEIGDSAILRQQLQLTEDNVQMIRQGCETLARWRTAARSKSV